MLLKYLTATLGAPVDALDFDAGTATNVTSFLDHLVCSRRRRVRVGWAAARP